MELDVSKYIQPKLDAISISIGKLQNKVIHSKHSKLVKHTNNTKSFYLEVFIFAAPPHDCSTLLSRKNMTTVDGASGQFHYDADDNSIKKGIIAYDYTSLFPTLTSDVRFLNYLQLLQSNSQQFWIRGNNRIFLSFLNYVFSPLRLLTASLGV